MQDRAPPAGSFTTVAEPAARGQRLDRFLADAIGTLSRSRVKSLIEQGHARRDGQRAQRAGRAGPARRHLPLDLPAPVPATPQPQAIPFTILYEDADLIVLDKPAGLVVHPAPGNEDGTLVNALLAHCGDQLTGIGGERRPGIVHRLDKDTSGVMVVAKTQLANAALTAAFAARDLDRAYLALVWGLPNPLAGEIEGADRPRQARSQADGCRRPRRQARAHPLPHACAPGRPRSPCWNAGSPPDGRIRSASTSPAAATRWSATRFTCAACRPSPARCPSPVRQRLLDFPAPGAARGAARLRPSTHRPAAQLRHRAAGRHGAADRRTRM